MVFPVPSYSLKQVAPCACDFEWTDENIDGAASVLLFYQYLETGDQDILDKIVQYNRDDCNAMVKLHEWIRALPDQGIDDATA